MADKNDSRKEKRIVNFDRGDELSRELSAGRDQDIEKQAKSEVKDKDDFMSNSQILERLMAEYGNYVLHI